MERRVRVVWKGAEPILLRWIDLRIPSQPAAPGALLEAPGYPMILHQKLADLPMGQWPAPEDRPDRDAPAWRMGLFATTAAERNLLIWPFDRDIPAVASVHRGPGGVWFNHRLFASRRLRTNESVAAGTQYVRVAGADLKQALREFQPFWAKAGIAPQHDVPEWARTARIYEAHLGPYRTLTPYPDVETLARDLPRIRAMGFNVIQLMPRMPYPSYSVHDYRDIETHYAPEAALRAMVKKAHELGLKVILDVIMHGVSDKAASQQPKAGVPTHPWTKEHPEWFSRNEYGTLARTYTWSFDHANSGFQDFMVSVFVDDYIRKLDVDGFRVDAVTWNFFPNWAEGLAYPGYKSIYASARLFERVRREATRIKPELLFVTESSGPLFHTSFDLTYNYDELWMYGGLLPVKPGTTPRGGRKVLIDARQMAEWLELRKLALPPSLGRVHQADSHDTKQTTEPLQPPDLRRDRPAAGVRLVRISRRRPHELHRRRTGPGGAVQGHSRGARPPPRTHGRRHRLSRGRTFQQPRVRAHPPQRSRVGDAGFIVLRRAAHHHPATPQARPQTRREAPRSLQRRDARSYRPGTIARASRLRRATLDGGEMRITHLLLPATVGCLTTKWGRPVACGGLSARLDGRPESLPHKAWLRSSHRQVCP